MITQLSSKLAILVSEPTPTGQMELVTLNCGSTYSAIRL